MAYKFSVGQAVKYKPIGAKVGCFKVVRQMPEEFQAIDRKYRIKSDQESFERNVPECDLRPSTFPEAVWPAEAASPYRALPLIRHGTEWPNAWSSRDQR